MLKMQFPRKRKQDEMKKVILLNKIKSQHALYHFSGMNMQKCINRKKIH